jgi:hypothetical protein
MRAEGFPLILADSDWGIFHLHCGVMAAIFRIDAESLGSCSPEDLEVSDPEPCMWDADYSCGSLLLLNQDASSLHWYRLLEDAGWAFRQKVLLCNVRLENHLQMKSICLFFQKDDVLSMCCRIICVLRTQQGLKNPI